MPPPPLFDLAGIELDRVVLTREEVYARLPQRHEFMQLDGVVHIDLEHARGIGVRHVRDDEWWVRGHVPGKPILPGVLLLEMAAQTSAVLNSIAHEFSEFLAFGGVEECKFRGAVYPPATIYMLCQELEFRPRRLRSRTQALVDDRIVFEAVITGLRLE